MIAFLGRALFCFKLKVYILTICTTFLSNTSLLVHACVTVKNLSVYRSCLPTALPGEEAHQKEAVVIQAQLLQLH